MSATIRSANLRRSELRRLYRMRLGAQLSDSDLDAYIFAIVGADFRKLDPDHLGRIVMLTHRERLACGIKTIRCIDKTQGEVLAIARETKNQADRDNRLASKRRKGEVEGSKPSGDLFNFGELPPRCAAVLDCLPPRKWKTINNLLSRLASNKLFVNLPPDTLRQTMHRCVHKLADRGLVLVRDQPDSKKRPAPKEVRRRGD